MKTMKTMKTSKKLCAFMSILLCMSFAVSCISVSAAGAVDKTHDYCGIILNYFSWEDGGKQVRSTNLADMKGKLCKFSTTAFSNATGTDFKPTVIVAVYDAGDNLICAGSNSPNDSSNAKQKEIVVGVNLSSYTGDTSKFKVRAFCWHSLDDITPYAAVTDEFAKTSLIPNGHFEYRASDTETETETKTLGWKVNYEKNVIGKDPQPFTRYYFDDEHGYVLHAEYKNDVDGVPVTPLYASKHSIITENTFNIPKGKYKLSFDLYVNNFKYADGTPENISNHINIYAIIRQNGNDINYSRCGADVYNSSGRGWKWRRWITLKSEFEVTSDLTDCTLDIIDPGSKSGNKRLSDFYIDNVALEKIS